MIKTAAGDRCLRQFFVFAMAAVRLLTDRKLLSVG